MIVLAHILHSVVEPVTLLVVPGAIVLAWQMRDARRARARSDD